MHQYYVQSAKQITPSTLLLTLEKDPDETRIFSFQPGQYAAISYKRKGRQSVARCFSIVSSPTDQTTLQFSMRTRGKYTSALTKLQPGDEVKVRGPYGGFIFDTERDQKAVLVAGGIGITPFISMMQFASKLKMKNDITLLYGVASQDDIPFFEELSDMEAANPHLRVVYVVGSGATDRLKGRTVTTGYINQDVLDLHAQYYDEATYFVCGPPPFMRGVLASLRASKVPARRLMTEAFGQGPNRQTGKVISWPQNMYVMGGVGLAMGTLAIMVTDVVKSLPQTAFVQGDGAIDLLTNPNDRENDIDSMINELPTAAQNPNSTAVTKALKAAQKKNSAPQSAPIYYTAPASGSSTGTSTSAAPKPAAATQPVCTTSQSGITTCN